MNANKLVKFYRHVLLILISLFMTACAAPPAKVSAYDLEQQASKAYVDKKWKLAEEKYSELISSSPGVAEVWFRLGNIYAHTKRPKKAISAYQEAIVRQPDYGKAWHNLGVISLQQTTSIFLEMLKNLKPDSERYKQAKKTAEALIGILESRRKVDKATLKASEAPKINKQKSKQ